MNMKMCMRRLFACFLVISMLVSYIPSSVYANETDDGIFASTSSDDAIEIIDDCGTEEDRPFLDTADGDTGDDNTVGTDDASPLDEVESNEQNDTVDAVFAAFADELEAKEAEEFEDDGDYLPTIEKQPESVEIAQADGRKVSLTVTATATGGGALSYQWYQVRDSGAEAIEGATSSKYRAPISEYGSYSYYCEVTNTVNGRKYSVNTDLATVLVYGEYVQSLTVTKGDENGEQVLREYGTWKGKEFNITLDSAETYTLKVLPLNPSMTGFYSMTVSYNGESAEVGAFQSVWTLDTSKISDAGGYFTVQVGVYDSEKQTYISSELYKFNVTITGNYLPTIEKQPGSVEIAQADGRKVSLTVTATATGGGALSYQWYQVRDSGAEAIEGATSSKYRAPISEYGSYSYYCEVTNTVNGRKYSVNTDLATVLVYGEYVQSLTVTKGDENGEQVLREYGTWKGKEFNITLDSAETYTLKVLPLNPSMTGFYSMTVSYNGESAEVGAFQSVWTLDTSKISDAGGYFTVQVGVYDSEKQAYTSSELYKFNVTKFGGYLPTIEVQPESVAGPYVSMHKASLTVTATATGNGKLSYQWYLVGEDGAEAIEGAVDYTYEAPVKKPGVQSYYCVVINTVNGEEYSVETDIVTVTAYREFLQALAFCTKDTLIKSYSGNWQGAAFDVELSDLGYYELRLQPKQYLTSDYSMTVSYNGVEGVAEPFKNVVLDISRLSNAGSYFTIEVGNYDEANGSYTSSEKYRFNIALLPGIKSITLADAEKTIPVDVDFGKESNSNKTTIKSTEEASKNDITIKIETNRESTQVFIGSNTTPTVEQTVSLAEYKTEYENGIAYAVVPVRLVAASGAEHSYAVMVRIPESHIKFVKQPADAVCYIGDKVRLEVEAEALDGGVLSYQWYEVTQAGGKEIPDGNRTVCNLTAGTVGDTSYYCIVTDTNDEIAVAVKSNVVTVSVKDTADPTPVIVTQPQNWITCGQGDEVVFSIKVLKPPVGELSYQWYWNDNPIDEPSAKTKDYKPSTEQNRTKYIHCEVTNTVDGKTYTTKSNQVQLDVQLTKYIHEPNVVRQPGSFTVDSKGNVSDGTYEAVARSGSAPNPFWVKYEWMDNDTNCSVKVYHSTSNSYEDAELVESATIKSKLAYDSGVGTPNWYKMTYEINPNTAYPTGEHYFYVVITLSPSDKNSTVKPVSTKSDILKIDFTDREMTMDGAGTEQNPYLIKTTEHLSEIQKMVSDGDSFAGAYFQIANDVSLPTNWTPIGTRDTAFSGHIDGNHKKLTVPAGEKPLLGCINGASVKDLDIYGEQIEGAGLVDDFTGVGLSGSAIVLDNVTLKSGSKTLKSGLVAAGAGNGYASASAGFVMTIRNCTIESNVVVGYTGTESQIGSFAGRFQGTIENCTSSATVKGADYVGGIIGTRDNALAECVVRNSTFHGTVESSGSYAGGIVGGGYDNSTAPNGACPTILACTVDGTVKGNERVGGIFGGDGFVAQTWDNVVGSISANSFTGKVSGSKYVGAIIGYRDSLNRYDNISANTFSAGCGADRGIGFVKYLDTSYANPTKMNGTIVFNTANGTSGCPAVEGCAWRANHNRTDDPLGKDADKLCKKIGGSSADPICYELTVSGSYKTEYNLGEELNLNGIKLTATWTNGTTSTVSLSDVTIDGYDKNAVGNQTVSLTYGAAVAYITVTVKPVSTKITVSVTIKGDSKHGDTSTPHGLARGGLTTWASESGVEADTAETVWDVLQRVAKKHGITFTADSNNSYGTVYIRAVNGLGEFDNGKNSGWMYTVNGTHPEVGVSAKYLKNGDNIVLHYTDDYDYEEGGNKYGQKPSGGTTTGGGSTGGTTTGGTTGTSMITTADRNKAAAVDKLIEKIGTVTKDSGPAIEAARKAYNDLTPTQKRLVNRLKELTDAEKAYAKLTATAEDQQKAQEVMDKIKKIGNVTKDSKQDINDARKAYDALTDLQKLLVDNYDVLTAAETKFAMLDTLGKVSEPYISTGEYMEKLGTPSVGAIGGEWMVIGLARSGRAVPGVEDYYQKAVEYVQQSIDPDTGRLHKAKSTDNSRMILALTAIGKDVTNVGGHNLLAGLSDLEFVKYQGNNGPIWALLALDSGNYPVPSGGTTTRQALIDEILSVQTSDGGWAISGDRADSDMTGMALTALAPYYKKDPTVKQAIDKAIARLSEMQDDDGGFSTTYGDGKYIATSESTAQVLTALSALGIDGDTDSRFVKNGSSVVDALLRYYVKGGGFKHIMDGEIDGMGTEQAYYALTAYYRFLSGKTSLYDMTDIIDMGGDVVTVEPTVPAATEPTEAAQTNIPWWIIAVCIFGGAGWGVVIGIVLVPKLNKKKD